MDRGTAWVCVSDIDWVFSNSTWGYWCVVWVSENAVGHTCGFVVVATLKVALMSSFSTEFIYEIVALFARFGPCLITLAAWPTIAGDCFVVFCQCRFYVLTYTLFAGCFTV